MGYQALLQASACVNFIHRPQHTGLDSSLENKTRDSPRESQRAEPTGRDREEMLRKCWDDGNMDAFPPNSLPGRALRGISMFYSWHRPVAGFLRYQWFLPGLRAGLWAGGVRPLAGGSVGVGFEACPLPTWL